MSTEFTPSERETLLRAASCGELDRTRPEVAERLASDPDLAREIDEVERARVTTARVMHEARDMLAEARGNASAADRALVEQGLRALAATAGTARPRIWPWIIVAAAAALVIAFFALRPHPVPPTPAVETWLGDQNGRLESAHAENGGFVLSWTVNVRTLETLELTFYADEGGHPGAVLLGPLEVRGDSWAPDEAQARALGESWFAELVRRSGDEAHLEGTVGPPKRTGAR